MCCTTVSLLAIFPFPCLSLLQSFLTQKTKANQPSFPQASTKAATCTSWTASCCGELNNFVCVLQKGSASHLVLRFPWLCRVKSGSKWACLCVSVCYFSGAQTSTSQDSSVDCRLWRQRASAIQVHIYACEAPVHSSTLCSFVSSSLLLEIP